jgi:hypothetical protein
LKRFEKDLKKKRKKTNKPTPRPTPFPFSISAGPAIFRPTRPAPPASPPSLSHAATDRWGPPVGISSYLRPSPPSPRNHRPRRLPRRRPASSPSRASSPPPLVRRRPHTLPPHLFPSQNCHPTEPHAINGGHHRNAASHRLPGLPPPRLYL